MRLDALLAGADRWPGLAEHVVTGRTDLEITAVHHDARLVEPGSLFCCVVGARADGHDFAQAALRAGAVALVCERPVAGEATQVLVPSVRAAMGPLAAVAAGEPSKDLQVVGITGTNGKTTTAHLLAAVLEGAGRPTEIIGTLSGARTTPEAPELQRLLSGARDAGRVAVAMEVSSHALDQHRVDGTRFAVGVFTNLSRDHLDYHHTMAAYFQTKARLFEPELCDLAVVNLDDPNGRLLRDAARIPTVGFSLADVSDVRVDAAGTNFRWRGQRLRVPLAGTFNLENALAALTVAGELGVAPADAAEGLEQTPPVPGRFEVIDAGQSFVVAVDFAHTPDGLQQLLGAGRVLAGAGKVILVFGAGGERDRSKRPEMGEVAVSGADRIILTSDNPRGEDPLVIIEEVTAGMHDATDLAVEPDRRAAIRAALAAAAPGDVVLVAGKGHETHQIIGDRTLPFDDRVVVREELGELGHGAT